MATLAKMATRGEDHGMPKDKRRQYGTGSVYQRCDHPDCPPLVDGPPGKDGKPTRVRPKHSGCKGTWIGTVEAGFTKTGARRRITVKAKSEAEAKRKLRDKQRQIATEGAPSSDASGRTTVKAWAEEWLTIIVHDLRPGSFNSTRGSVRNWIVPTIGHRRLEHLTPADVRAVANAQREAGRSTSTALRTHSDLMQLLRAALQEGHRVPPRVLTVKGPGKAVHDRQALVVDDALRVLRVASELPHGTRYAVGFLQGMRQGECLGLTWPHLDLDAGLISVSWQLQPLPYLDKKDRSRGFRIPDGFEARHLVGAYHLVRPKSRKGWRVIPLVPWLWDALVAWRDVAPPNPYGLVWPNLDGSPTSAKDDLEEFHALQGAAEVGHPAGRYYHVHEMRHSTATLLMASKAPDSVRIAIMGHSSVAVTHGYEHADQAEARRALESVAERLQLH